MKPSLELIATPTLMLRTRWVLLCIQEHFIREGLRQTNQLHRASVSSFIIHLEIPKWLLMIIWECCPMGRISLCPHLALLKYLLPAWYQRQVLGRLISGWIWHSIGFLIILAVTIFLSSLQFVQILPLCWQCRQQFWINSYDKGNRRSSCQPRNLMETAQFSQKLANLVFVQALRACWFGPFLSTFFFLYIECLKCRWYLTPVN